MNIPHDAIFQNCINGSAAPNRRTAKAPYKKSFKRHLLNHRPVIQKKNHRIIPHDALYQNFTNGSSPLIRHFQVSDPGPKGPLVYQAL